MEDFEMTKEQLIAKFKELYGDVYKRQDLSNGADDTAEDKSFKRFIEENY